MRRLNLNCLSFFRMNSAKLNKNILSAPTSRRGDLCVLQMFTVSGGSSG